MPLCTLPLLVQLHIVERLTPVDRLCAWIDFFIFILNELIIKAISIGFVQRQQTTFAQKVLMQFVTNDHLDRS